MATVNHSAATGIHPGAYHQTVDPGAVGAGVLWVNLTAGPPWPISVRNAANTGWEVVNSSTLTTELAASDFKPSGLTGAVAASRYAGATAGGAPVAGTFAIGDFVVDNVNGRVYVCTAAGTPGTWTQVGGASALTNSVNQLASNVTMAVANTFYDGPALSLVAGVWLLNSSLLIDNGGTAAHVTVKLWDGTTSYAAAQITATNYYQVPLTAIVSPGSTVTYKVSAANQAATTGVIRAAPFYNSPGNYASTLTAIKIG